jgi:hypothetical protein
VRIRGRLCDVSEWLDETLILFLTLGVVGLVDGEELVADEVVSWREGGGDGACPYEGVEDRVAGPDALVLRAGDQACLVDLDYKQCELVG